MNFRLEIGLQFDSSVLLRRGFLIFGLRIGIYVLVNDKFVIFVMVGRRVLIYVFKLLFGNGFNMYDLVLVLLRRVDSLFIDFGLRELLQFVYSWINNLFFVRIKVRRIKVVFDSFYFLYE